MAKLPYTLLNENGYVIYVAFYEEGQQPENAVPEMVTEWMVKPQFDFVTRTYSETATPEEWRQKVLDDARNTPKGTDRDNFLLERGVTLTPEELEYVQMFDPIEE